MAGFERLIREIADFPRPGIRFQDMSPVLADGAAFAEAVAAMAAPWRGSALRAVAGVEARGFILGAAVARELGVGFVPLRKPGKLPGEVLEVRYALEYGEDRLQVQRGAVPAGARVLLIDDVLATGGTLAAAVGLLDALAVDLVGGAVLLEIAALGGRSRWRPGLPLHATVVT